MTKKNPYMKFFCADWRAEPRLRMSSLAARGLWIDLITYMHEGEPYGHLTIDKTAPDLEGICALVSRPMAEVRKAIAELEARQVFSRTSEGVIFSRRMVRDKAKADADAANGKAGGNPALIQGVNPPEKPPDKAQSPESTLNATSQKVKIESSLGEAKREDSPPRHCATTAKAGGRVYVVKGTPEWEAYAADFRAATGKDPHVNQHGGKWFKTMGEASGSSQ